MPKRTIEIGPSVTGNPNLHWFPMDERHLMLIESVPGYVKGTERKMIVLDTTGLRTEKALIEAQKQKENDFAFETDDVIMGSIGIAEERS
jgi:hypothetical protein